MPGVYGIPEQWPHVAGLYQRAGFRHTGQTEVVYLARVQDLPDPGGVPVEGLAVRRSVGINGCRLSAVLGPEVTGYIEVEILDEGERLSRHGGWADVGNLHVMPPYQRRGVGTWLLGQAAGWLRLAEVSRLLPTPGWKAPTPAAELRRVPCLPACRRIPRADPHGPRLDQGVSMDHTNQVAVELTLAIKGGDIPALERLLASEPGLATVGIVGRDGPEGGIRTPLHIVADWPGYFPNGPAIVGALIEREPIPMSSPADTSRRRRCTGRPAATTRTWPKP